MKVVYLIGVPGTGKSTIMKELMCAIQGLAPSTDAAWKQERVTDLLDTHVFGDFRILGKYEAGETFSGTDRLSMAVAPKAIEWIQTKPDEIIFGEGDRLNNRGFFEACGEDLTIVHLTVSDEERERRYKERGSDQSEKFIQTTRTKCKNIIEAFGDKETLFGVEKGCVVEMRHETPEDTIKIVDFLLHK